MLIRGPDTLGAADRKAWPPILPPDFAATADSTDPSVSVPAANATIASLANFTSPFSLLSYQSKRNKLSYQFSEHGKSCHWQSYLNASLSMEQLRDTSGFMLRLGGGESGVPERKLS